MITADRKQFSRALDLAHTVIERRNAIPALGGVKVLANGALVLEGSDLDCTTRVEMAYTGSDASFCLPAGRQIRSALGAAGGDAAQFTPAADGKTITLASGELSADLLVLPADDHPGADRIAAEEFSCVIGAGELRQIARVMPVVSTEETRYYLNGVCVHHLGDWTWRFVATDGHRLHMVDIPLPGAVGALPDKMIIPRRWLNIAVAQFAKAKDGAALVFGRTAGRNEPGVTLEPAPIGAPRFSLAASFAGVDFTLTGKPIDGTFPDYTRVIPKDNAVLIRLKRADLAQALHTLAALASGKVRAVRLSAADGALICELHSPELGKSRFRLPADHNAPPGFFIGFNARYLLETLAVLHGEEIELRCADPGAPTLITDPADTAFRAVLMPMRT